MQVIAPNTGIQTFVRGEDEYYVYGPNGNAIGSVSDKKIQHDDNNDGIIDYYTADVRTATMFSSYGAMTKSFNGDSLGFAFNGQKRSKEISPTAQTAQFWEYDGDVGRRWNLDVRPTTGISDYSVFLNNPIWRTDVYGDTPTVKEAALMADDSYRKFSERNKELESKFGWNRVEKVTTSLFGKGNQEVSLDELGALTGYNMALYSRTLNGKTEWALANAGTADGIDVGSDARQTIGSSDQYAFSVGFAKSLENGMKGQEITYVGHSLGGGLAAANSLATGSAAITFNPAGVSWGTRQANNLPKDKRDGQIKSFVVGGEAVDRSQRLIGSKANGQITYIHPQYGTISKTTALGLRFTTDVMTSVQYHMMSTVIQALNKAGIK